MVLIRWAPERDGLLEKKKNISFLPGFETRAVQSVA